MAGVTCFNLLDQGSRLFIGKPKIKQRPAHAAVCSISEKKKKKNTQARQLRRGSNQSRTARNTAGEQVERVELAERVPSPRARALQ